MPDAMTATAAEIRMSTTSARFWRNIVRTYVKHSPVHRGKRYVMETLAPFYATAGETRCQLPGGAMISADLREHVQRWIYFFGAYEQESVAWFRSALRPGMTVLDIGANVGQYSLIAGSDVGPHGRVHSFEPNPGTFRRLSANIELNGFRHVTAHRLALSDTAGTATLYVPTHDNMGEASLQQFDPGAASTTTPTLTADEWMETADLGTTPRIDVIKIDVQGFETKVIQGARGLLARFTPTVLCEFEDRWLKMAGSSSVELKELFTSLGYTPHRITPGGLAAVAMEESHSFDNLVMVPKR
jgi:FkbM family methyltransferase